MSLNRKVAYVLAACSTDIALLGVETLGCRRTKQTFWFGLRESATTRPWPLSPCDFFLSCSVVWFHSAALFCIRNRRSILPSCLSLLFPGPWRHAASEVPELLFSPQSPISCGQLSSVFLTGDPCHRLPSLAFVFFFFKKRKKESGINGPRECARRSSSGGHFQPATSNWHSQPVGICSL